MPSDWGDRDPGRTHIGWRKLFRLAVVVSEALADDARALRAALKGKHDKASVTLELPRASAEKILAPLDFPA